MLRETAARIKDRGVGVYDVEVVWLKPDFDAKTLARFFEVCAALGAKAILVGGTDPDVARMTQSFAALCAAAKPYGLTADLEFMPWTAVPDVRTAHQIVGDAGRSNGGMLVDALHFARSSSTLADIRAVPASWLHYAQICDAPALAPETTDGLVHAARRERLLQGDGGLALRELFGVLPVHVPVSIELPNDRRIAKIGSREWARLALSATRQVLE